MLKLHFWLRPSVDRTLAVLHMSVLAMILIEPAAATFVALRAGDSHVTTAGRITLAVSMKPVFRP